MREAIMTTSMMTSDLLFPNLDKYLGMNLSQAKALAVIEDYDATRVVEEDGEAYIITMEYCPTRINFVLRAGKVVRAYAG